MMTSTGVRRLLAIGTLLVLAGGAHSQMRGVSRVAPLSAAAYTGGAMAAVRAAAYSPALAAAPLTSAMAPALAASPAFAPAAALSAAPAHAGLAVAAARANELGAGLMERLAAINAPEASASSLRRDAAELGESLNGGRLIRPVNDGPVSKPSSEESNNAAIYKKVLPSVVTIQNLQLVRQRTPYGYLQEGVVPRGHGSGYVWSKDGYIVTNFHVAQGGAGFIVSMSDGKELEAKLIGYDATHDVAVLKVDPAAVPLKPIERGNSDLVEVGHKAVAIGAPFGLENTMTVGIVSALNRTMQGPSGEAHEMGIQTDAAINPGNSGGPLVNRDGQLIGMNTSIASPRGAGNIGIGFAVPVNKVKAIVESIISQAENPVARRPQYEQPRRRYVDPRGRELDPRDIDPRYFERGRGGFRPF